MLPPKSEPKPAHLLFLAALAAGFLLAPLPARAAGDVRTDSALALVPADASFYSAMLRNKEQIDIVLKSKTYKKLMDLPGVKKALEQATAEMKKEDGPYAIFLKMLETKENKELTEVLIDAVSNEIFVYGGPGWADLLTILMKANGASSLSPIEAALSGGDPSKAQGRAMLRELDKHKAKLKVPELVIGFKVSDPKKAEGQLKRLEKVADKLLESVPGFKGKIKRTKLADGESVLTLDLQSAMIPWDEINLKDLEEKEGEFKDLMKHLKGLKAAVTLGVKGGYLLLSFTTSSNDLEKLGGKGKKLADVEDLAPLAKHAKKPITSLGYASKALSAAAMTGNDLSDYVTGTRRILDKADLPAARKKAIEKDLDDVAQTWKKYTPSPSSLVSVSFMTDEGLEGFEYRTGDFSSLKGLKFRLLDHFGGKPIFAGGAALAVSGEGYQDFARIVKMGYAHAESIFMEKADDDAKDKYKKFTKDFFPLMQKLHDTTSKLLLPSLKDGALGMVVDAKWRSKKWVKAGPDFAQPMPMAEVGLMLGLSDSAKFTKAIKEYRLTLNEIYEKVREVNKDNVPEFKIPAPETEKVAGGEIYFHPIPEDVGLDRQFLPNAGVGKKVAVITLSKSHTERLLKATPLEVTSGPLAGKKDILGACYFDFPAFLDAITPWVTIAPDLAPAENKEEVKKGAKEALAAIDLLKAFQGFTCATYLEDGLLVSHSQVRLQDR